MFSFCIAKYINLKKTNNKTTRRLLDMNKKLFLMISKLFVLVLAFVVFTNYSVKAEVISERKGNNNFGIVKAVENCKPENTKFYKAGIVSEETKRKLPQSIVFDNVAFTLENAEAFNSGDTCKVCYFACYVACRAAGGDAPYCRAICSLAVPN
jgi:hypothetical protein